jgi:PAS domain S-box-containing protein
MDHDALTTQQALAESQRRYRLVVENATDVIWTAELDRLRDAPGGLNQATAVEFIRKIIDGWTFSYLSPSMEHVLGYHVEDAMRLGPKELFTPASYDAAVDGLAEELCIEQQPGRDPNRRRIAELELRTRQGDTRWCEVSLTFLRDGDGRLGSLVGAVRDISERKAAEESLRKEQEFLRHLLDLLEREREVISFELHDSIAQHLTGAQLLLESSAQLQSASPEEARHAFCEGLRLLRESIQETRRLVSGLRPPALDAFGVLAAIEHLVEENRRARGPVVELLAPDDLPRLARPLENALFRIVQESLSNLRRHSRTERACLEICCDDSHVRLVIRDFGVGFDPGRAEQGHFGLKGIRQRARLLGGRVQIESAPGSGTCIRVELPLVRGA